MHFQNNSNIKNTYLSLDWPTEQNTRGEAVRKLSVPMCSSRKNPYPPHRRSLEIPRGRGPGGGGGLEKKKILEAKYEAKLEFLKVVGGAKQKKTFHGGGSMAISWNCTILNKNLLKL